MIARKEFKRKEKTNKKNNRRVFTGARTDPEKLGPSSDASPALSTSCLRSEYSLFLEMAVGGEVVAWRERERG